jgi:hypothetical protein
MSSLVIATALATTFLLGATAKPPALTPKPTTPFGALKAELIAKHGVAQTSRVVRGVDQVAALWRPEDGDLEAFARESFVSEPRLLDVTFRRFEYAFEQLDGHFLEIGRELRRPTDLDEGELLAIDKRFAAFDPSAHLLEDLFASKLAFTALLNFPLTTLEERTALASSKGGMSRRAWAESRLTQRFAQRVPADVLQRITEAQARADLYIAEYNVWMHHVVDQDGARLFPKGKRLISHWNLRDELKAAYADTAGTAKQRALVKIMERIVTQTIPAVVVNNPRVDWNPWTNAVAEAPAATVEADAPKPTKSAQHDVTAPEPSTRYAHLLEQFHAAKAVDPFSPSMPTAIQRSYELGRQLSEARVKALLTEVLTSPLVPKVKAEIEHRLGRKLEPQDLWYDGFKARASINESDLDALTQKRYPTKSAFAADLPRILTSLGFSDERARFLSSYIVVDAARGAGHALQSARRGDLPHLRTRIEKDGMNYKGYNIAVHELGHNVEQVISLYEVDHTLLAGVPNNAFTEALAFVFQARDLDLLGLTSQTPQARAQATRDRVLADFWATWEIAGVALVDVAVWHWMYEHPSASPDELRDAVVKLSKETWDRYYAPVLGGAGTTLLGIYSHMIAYPLYLADYPLGHLIAFQIEEQLEKSKALGVEFERMAKTGAVAPDVWMKTATGAPVSAAPLLRATERALRTKAASGGT